MNGLGDCQFTPRHKTEPVPATKIHHDKRGCREVCDDCYKFLTEKCSRLFGHSPDCKRHV